MQAEGLDLDRGDVDLAAARVVVRHGKFDKICELARHPTSVAAMAEYHRLHDSLPRPGHRRSWCPSRGTRLLYCNVRHTFHRLVGLAGLPRIHDLRQAGYRCGLPP